MIRAFAGEYDQRVTIWQNKSDRSANTDGQRPEDSEQYIQRWARVKPISGGERFLAQQTKADVTHRVWMHSDSRTRAITPKMWLTLRDGTRLNIKRVFDAELRNIEVELECNQRI